jgi:hyperosmotically inducible periplasmic protein
MRKAKWFLTAAAAAAIGLSQPVTAFAAPDAWITAKTKIALMTADGVSATDVNVDTVDGRVTLHGTVSSAEEKAKAETEARKIDGVKEVRNLLQVVPKKREDAVKASDKDLKDRVAKALDDDPTLTDSSISVQSVNNGVVLLDGSAKSVSDHLRAIARAGRGRGEARHG